VFAEPFLASNYRDQKDTKATSGSTMPATALKGPSAFIDAAADLPAPVGVEPPEPPVVEPEPEPEVEFEKTVRYRISQNAFT